jgi:uncharacterized protein (DUF2225 family)
MKSYEINNIRTIGNSDGIRPEDRSDSNIFGGLGRFGLNDAEAAQVFSVAEESKPEREKKIAEQDDPESGIYMRSFKCPICGAEAKIPAIRSSYLRLIKNDSDFMPVYKDPNPLFYFITFCKLCGFAAMSATIRELTEKQKKLIREKIGASWNYDKKLPDYYDIHTAIEIHKLALYNAVVARLKESAKSIISLHIAWLYRIMGDEKSELLFMNTAREGFERAYLNESDPNASLDKNSLQFLIGELYRRTGNMTGALNWFKLVLFDRDAKKKIKDYARDQKDWIMDFYASEGKAQ